MKKENNKKIKMISVLIIITAVGIIGINYNFYSSSTDDTFIAVNNTDVPANSYFDDINFYKCVVDAYNRINSTSEAYTVNLTDEQLNTIDALNCSGDNKTDDKKINSAKGIEKLTALTSLGVSSNNLTELDVSNNTALKSLYVYSNNLTELDVSNNTALTSLDVFDNNLTELDISNNTALTDININNNPFGKVIYIYKGGSASAENPVKLPSNFDLNFSGWVVSDSNVVSVDEDGDITTLSVGTVDIKASTNYYTITNTIKVVEITSDKYDIDEKNNNINIGNDNSKEEILNNINKSDENIDIEVDLNKNKLYVKANNNILKTFDLSNLNSTYSDSNEYVDTTIDNPKTGLYYGLVILGVLLFGGTIVVIKLKKHNKLLKL